MRIVSIQVGKPARRGSLRTAYGKLPVAGAIRLGRENLDGDAQAWRHHGGPEMAVLAYAADHYPRWREELSWPELSFGGFGENLSVEGAAEDRVCIGDIWQAGSALLQISSPRKPCSKISRFWGRRGLMERVIASARTGFYLRVLEEGALEAGDGIALRHRLHPEWTVARAVAVALCKHADRDVAAQLNRVAALSPRWKAWLRGEPARV